MLLREEVFFELIKTFFFELEHLVLAELVKRQGVEGVFILRPVLTSGTLNYREYFWALVLDLVYCYL